MAQPENVLDYEAGIKSDFMLFNIIPARANIDAYTTAFHNLQSQQNLPNITLAVGPSGVAGTCTQALYNANQCTTPTNALNNVTFNADRARIYGTEWDITAIPTGLRIPAP